MIRHIQSPGIVRTDYSSIVNNIQGYSEIFGDMHIKSYAQSGNQEGSRGGLHYPFLKMEKSALILEDPNFVHLKARFSIQNAILENVGEKTQNVSSYGPFFSSFCQNVYRSALVPRNFPYPEKFLVKRLNSGVILFCKTLHLKSFTMF